MIIADIQDSRFGSGKTTTTISYDQESASTLADTLCAVHTESSHFSLLLCAGKNASCVLLADLSNAQRVVYVNGPLWRLAAVSGLECCRP